MSLELRVASCPIVCNWAPIYLERAMWRFRTGTGVQTSNILPLPTDFGGGLVVAQVAWICHTEFTLVAGGACASWCGLERAVEGIFVTLT